MIKAQSHSKALISSHSHTISTQDIMVGYEKVIFSFYLFTIEMMFWSSFW